MAYAALLSLIHNLEQILHQHLIPQNEQQIETLLERVNSLKDFLEKSSPKSSEIIESLESKIIVVTYKAEYVVESHISYGLVSESSHHGDEVFTNLEKVLEEINSIEQEVMNVEDEIGVPDLQTRMSSLSVASSTASSGKGDVVGLDRDMKEIKERLTRSSSKREIVSIVGMGGIGKTTLAKNVYDDEYIVDYFDVTAWVTVSQDYEVQEILQRLLDSMKKCAKETKPDEDSNVESSTSTQLKDVLYKFIKGRRYLVVMDDVWDTKFWDDVERLFPDDNNGSRIMLTSRLENVAVYFTSTFPLHHMYFLNEDNSWELLRKKIFGEDFCPQELVEIGKKIAQNCQGLPLAVVVIGGLLSKDIKTERHWRNVAENLSSAITSNDDQLSKILSLSYNHLPHHLKGCFLYMGIFPEDFNICVPMLVKLWVAEGILQPVKSKSLEAVAYEYLLDLVDRNLVLAFERSWDGKIKICKVHDLLRDLCKREAERKNFFHVINENFDRIPTRGDNVHRVSIHRDREILYFRCINLPISLMQSSLFVDGRLNLPVFASCSLLRVLHTGLEYRINLPDEIIRQVNLRYLSGRCNQRWPLESIYKLRNLQTLILYIDASVQLPPEIWNMTELRHVQLFGNVNLSDPPSAEIDGEDSIIVLENLHTLCCIRNFRCTNEVVRRIPNLKKLEISYTGKRVDWKYYCLNNLGQLGNLETLKCFFYGQSLQPGIFTFPKSLKKLTLRGCKLPWEDMMAVGSLPKLEVLKLKHRAFLGKEWKPTGKFAQLKFLQLQNIDLVYWIADSSHFPLLEHLVIKELYCMKEIPSGIGKIETLKLIEVHDCTSSVVTSAKEIQDHRQENMADEVFKVQIFY